MQRMAGPKPMSGTSAKKSHPGFDHVRLGYYPVFLIRLVKTNCRNAILAQSGPISGFWRGPEPPKRAVFEGLGLAGISQPGDQKMNQSGFSRRKKCALSIAGSLKALRGRVSSLQGPKVGKFHFFRQKSLKLHIFLSGSLLLFY